MQPPRLKPQTRNILLYGAALALGAFLLDWLEYRQMLHLLPPELYIVLIAIGFTLLGLWAGNRLTRRPAPPFQKNVKALEYLRISDREYEVLMLLAAGHGNKDIAARLSVSANTVKTHLARLYEKLGVTSRTQAIGRARELQLIP